MLFDQSNFWIEKKMNGYFDKIKTLKHLTIRQLFYPVVLIGCLLFSNTAIGQFIDNHDIVGDSIEVTTNIGVFVNPFQINFYGSANPANPPFALPFDIRVLCGTHFTEHGYAGNGTMFVMPEVGMVKMNNTCSDSVAGTGDTVHYTITLSSTNISLP